MFWNFYNYLEIFNKNIFKSKYFELIKGKFNIIKGKFKFFLWYFKTSIYRMSKRNLRCYFMKIYLSKPLIQLQSESCVNELFLRFTLIVLFSLNTILSNTNKKFRIKKNILRQFFTVLLKLVSNSSDLYYQNCCKSLFKT